MICVFHTITFAIKEEYEFIQDKIQKTIIILKHI